MARELQIRKKSGGVWDVVKEEQYYLYFREFDVRVPFTV